ncbi:MAG: hypothetical protein DRJ52_00770 [Thermoprotei archaeon]|nr:MAG: hypothetical protein DRJ52_00770 [Thermoprotei archaeon]HDI75233.1 hypothetical protein [Thermoprotei archaeon]
MSVLGFIKDDQVDENKLIQELGKVGLVVSSRREIKLKTCKNWKNAVIFEILGPTEGLAKFFASKYNVPFFEGPVILGEVSAKLWSEAVRIHYPSGESELIELFVCDSFLDVKIPTANVEGLSGHMVIGAKRYSLPLSKEDLREIASLGGALDKVVRAAEIYGSKVVDISLLRKAEEEVKEGVDYEAGYVIIMKGNRISTVPLDEYYTYIIRTGLLDKACRIFKEAPDYWKTKLKSIIEEEIKRLKEIKHDTKDLEELLKTLN